MVLIESILKLEILRKKRNVEQTWVENHLYGNQFEVAMGSAAKWTVAGTNHDF